MKKTISLLLALALCLGLTVPVSAAGNTAYASNQNVEVDGRKIEFQMYALLDANGNGTNYVKLRDVAHVLNGTSAQFSVGYDSASQAISVTSGQPYTDLGSEMYTPFSGDRSYAAASNPVVVNGKAASLEAISLTDDNGGGYTYFKLRDLGAALGFTVDWTAERGVYIETGSVANPETPEKPAGAVGGHYDVNVYDVPSDTNKDGWITEAEVQVVLDQLREEYPDGSPWGSSDYWRSSVFGGGYECAGFAFMVSDRIFGNLPKYQVHLEESRVGDVAQHGPSNHKAVFLNNYGENVLWGITWTDSYTTADGNISGKVGWDTINYYDDWPDDFFGTTNSVLTGSAIWSRYPKE